MKIDRTNYEIWFIDWLDGNLTEIEAEQLKMFLNENPDLREESRDLGPVNISHSGKKFQYKDQLKRSAAEIPLVQFEYLCAAFLENDLSITQQNELRDIIGQDAAKQRTFELIQKTRLSPPDIIFRHKGLLRKRTATQKIIRFSVLALSAAAVIAIIIMFYFNEPRPPARTITNTAQTEAVSEGHNTPLSQMRSNIGSADIRHLPAIKKKESKLSAISKVNNTLTKSEKGILTLQDTLRTRSNFSEPVPSAVSVNTNIFSKKLTLSNNLIASNLQIPIPAGDDGRSNIGRFIAKTFREKILKEKTSPDTPLRAYEIAEAGVTGLNKLLGWEMALDKRNDENGDLKSVYFSSRILKFNAPVKKTEPLP